MMKQSRGEGDEYNKKLGGEGTWIWPLCWLKVEIPEYGIYTIALQTISKVVVDFLKQCKKTKYIPKDFDNNRIYCVIGYL